MVMRGRTAASTATSMKPTDLCAGDHRLLLGSRRRHIVFVSGGPVEARVPPWAFRECLMTVSQPPREQLGPDLVQKLHRHVVGDRQPAIDDQRLPRDKGRCLLYTSPSP